MKILNVQRSLRDKKLLSVSKSAGPDRALLVRIEESINRRAFAAKKALTIAAKEKYTH